MTGERQDPGVTVRREAFLSHYNGLPVEKKAGFFLWPSLAGTEVTSHERELVEQYAPSGFVLFKRNLASFSQGRLLTTALRMFLAGKSSLRPVIAIDEEGGRVSRLPPPFPRGLPALHFAEKNDTATLREQVLHQIFVAKALGIDCFLAPVADILTEPSNPVMGDRCFGLDADTVTRFANVVYETLSSEGMLACAKHFPGHGNTRTDSHKEFAQSHVSLSELQQREWAPFQSLIQAGVPLCMTAHVLVPALDNEQPATLSPVVLRKWLRDWLGFNGLVLSDDLRMNAIAHHYKVIRRQDSSITEEAPISSGEEDDSFLELAAIDSLNAGVDILLSCQSIVKEEIILKSICSKLSKDDQFAKECEEKAWRIYSTLARQESPGA